MADLQDRVVIVSGVGPGLGRETALAAVRQGAKVLLAARTEATLQSVADEVAAAGGQAVYRRTDVTSAEDRQALVDLALERYGRIDGLILVAAMDAVFGGIGATENFDDWRQVMEVNLYSAMELVKVALPSLSASSGAVVFVSSQTWHHPPPLALQAAYAASKGAITAAMRHVVHEVGPQGVRINEVAPGWMLGPPVEGYVQHLANERGISYDEMMAEMTANMPLRRMATDGEVAEALVFFASPRASGITGQTLLINAGEVVH